ncbi:hypothetical protein Tco_0048652, partial [Tanacetum coccineum]
MQKIMELQCIMELQRTILQALMTKRIQTIRTILHLQQTKIQNLALIYAVNTATEPGPKLLRISNFGCVIIGVLVGLMGGWGCCEIAAVNG